MGIFNNTLYVGTNSLQAYGEALQVVGNNISNVNTLGFKSENMKFGDVLSNNRARLALGNGVQSVSVSQDLGKGSFQRSNSVTDMAIDGNGLFVLKNPVTNASEYTRVGDFALNNNELLVAGNGSNVQGWQLNAEGTAIGGVTDINVRSLVATAQASTTLDVGVNLDSTAVAISPAVAFDLNDSATYHYKSDVQLLDSLGVLHDMSIYYTKVGIGDAGLAAGTVPIAANDSVWEYHVVTDGANTTGGTAGTLVEINPDGTAVAVGNTPTASTVGAAAGSITVPGSQALVFDSATGALKSEISPAFTIPWTGAASATLNFNFGAAAGVDASGTLGNGTDGALMSATGFATRFTTRDGFPSGQLDRLEVDGKGKIFGVFTNGQRRPLYQVAVASFPAEDKLTKNGTGILTESVASGAAVIDKAGNGGLGSISAYSLEASNVDLANEFVQMIVVQRGYEANSKVVQTTDQMLQSLMQLKR